jgi:hypothetical protein
MQEKERKGERKKERAQSHPITPNSASIQHDSWIYASPLLCKGKRNGVKKDYERKEKRHQT